MREMKDSGIEWVGKVPATWKIMPNKYIMTKKKVIKEVYDGENIISLSIVSFIMCIKRMYLFFRLIELNIFFLALKSIRNRVLFIV